MKKMSVTLLAFLVSGCLFAATLKTSSRLYATPAAESCLNPVPKEPSDWFLVVLFSPPPACPVFDRSETAGDEICLKGTVYVHGVEPGWVWPYYEEIGEAVDAAEEAVLNYYTKTERSCP